MMQQQTFIPYPSIGRHAVIGDRRTAALVAADGTLDWLCLPNYDGAPTLGALLDVNRGGYWRLGPRPLLIGTQSYLGESAVAVTTWATREGELELTDFMPWPCEHRPPADEARRVIVRRLRCVRGTVECAMRLCPRPDFTAAARAQTSEGRWLFGDGQRSLGLWTTFPVAAMPGVDDAVGADLRLTAGDEHWAVLALDEAPSAWSVGAALQALEDTRAYWREWDSRFTNARGPRAARMRCSGMAIHLLSFAPDGSLVAAPTTSLPERIGGPRNYDYRYAWVRDASLCVFGLARLGDQESAARYMDWLAHRGSQSAMPLQVVYRISGDTALDETWRGDLAGYRGSRPVRIGNRAARQIQHGSLGYLADCALEHLAAGGDWRSEYWRLIARCADYIARHWHEADNGIWELPQREHYVSSKVLSWVTLDRAVTIAERTGRAAEVAGWRQTRDEIHQQVMEHGWSERRQCFVQHYDSEALDAAALLIPVLGFLPPDHPRVCATVQRVAEHLTIDGLVYRFEPRQASAENPDRLPMGAFEGTFFPCTFWLAAAYAGMGALDQAEAVLARAERVIGDCGLFAEEADPRGGDLLGNYPLLFSQVEYLRALLAVEEAREAQRPTLAGTAGGV